MELRSTHGSTMVPDNDEEELPPLWKNKFIYFFTVWAAFGVTANTMPLVVILCMYVT